MAKPKAKRPETAAPSCARAAFAGDPVCDIGGEKEALPTPSSRRIRRADENSGFLVGDRVSVDGKTNFNENRYGEAPLHKLTPRPPSRASSSGGAQFDFRF